MVEVPFLFAPKSDIFPHKETQMSKGSSHSPAALGRPGAPWGQERGLFLVGCEGFGSGLLHHPASLRPEGWRRRRPSTQSPNTCPQQVRPDPECEADCPIKGMLCEPVMISAGKSRAVLGRPVGEEWESVLGLGWGTGTIRLRVQEEAGQTQ